MQTLFAIMLLAAGPNPDTPWHALLGQWTGQGTLMGQPVAASLRFEPALGGRFIRLVYEARTPAGSFMFGGEGLYGCCEANELRGSWADTAGHLYPVLGRFEGSTLETEWGDPGIETGRSSYEATGPDSLRVIDRVLRGEVWEAFAEIEYERSGDG